MSSLVRCNGRIGTEVSLFQGSDSAANKTVPSRTPGGYHQLFTPNTRGKRPAEIAGAIGDFSARITATAPPTVRSTDRYPYGSARVKKTPIAPVITGVIASSTEALAQVPRGRVNTSWESAPSSGNKT